MDFKSIRKGTPGNDVFDNRVNPVFNTEGGAGDDSYITNEFANFQGGPGNDTILGGTSGATSIYWDSPSSIYVDIQAGYANDGWGTRDTLSKVSAIQATPFNDTLLGDDLNNQFWPNGGNDLIDGRGGVDELIISARPADVRWSRAGSDWRYEYNDSSGKLVSSSTVRNVELVKYYSDGAFSAAYRLLSAGSTPTLISFDAVAPKLDVELVAPTLWTISQFGVAVVPVTEAYPAFYYPTSADYHPPGIFLPNPHNAAVGDFNGDGRDDIWVSWVAFPHTVDRQTQLAPTVFMGTSTGLSALPASSVPASLNRHMAYRTMAADFNGDGIDDVAFGGMGVITRLAGGGFANEWERHGLAIFGGNTVTDGTGLLEGQGEKADLSNWGFAHDGSAGDVSGDGKADLYAGGRLWVSNATGGWNLATDYLPSAIPRSSPMSSAIGDLDGDSRQDLVMLWPSFGSSAFAVMSNGASYPAFTSVALPPPLYGSNSKANNCAIADINGDGLGDIVVATTRSEPYYQGAALQLLIQVSPGNFEDQTASRLDNSASDLSQGEGQLRIFDANGDGLIDIVHSLDSRGANIFLNDGSGHFTLYDLTSFPFVQSSQVQGLQSAPAGGQNQLSKLFPVDINSDGLSDFLSYVVLPDFSTHAGNIAALYTVLGSEQVWGRDKSETLAGTSQAEFIRGYGGSDAISGKGGNDKIDGGAGTDTAVYTGKSTDYLVAFDALSSTYGVKDSVNSRDGTDKLTSVESLQFSDGVKQLATSDALLVGRVHQALYGKAQGSAVFNDSLTKVAPSGSVLDWVKAEASGLSALSDSAFTTLVLNNMSITNTSLIATATFGTSQQAYDTLQQAMTIYLGWVGSANRGIVAAQVATIIAGFEGETIYGVYGAAATAFNKQVASDLAHSVNTQNTSEVVVVPVFTSGTVSALGDAFTYMVAMGSYNYQIGGFGTSDRIIGPTGVSGTLVNNNASDGSASIQYVSGGNTVSITLTGLSTAQDGALHGTADLNTVFGLGTFF